MTAELLIFDERKFKLSILEFSLIFISRIVPGTKKFPLNFQFFLNQFFLK